MSALSYIKLSMISLLRESFFKYDIKLSLKTAKILFYGYLSFCLYLALFMLSGHFKNIQYHANINLNNYYGIMIFLLFLIMLPISIFKFVNLISEVSTIDEKLKIWPIKTKCLYLPYILNDIVNSLIFFVLFSLPIYLIYLKTLRLDPYQYFVNSIVVFIFYQVFLLIIYYILGNFILRFIKIKLETLLSIFILGIMFSYLVLFVVIVKIYNIQNNNIDLLINTLNNLFSLPVLCKILLHQTAAEFLFFLLVSMSIFVLLIFAVLSLFDRIKFVRETLPSVLKVKFSYHNIFGGYNAGPILGYLKREVISFIRQPQIVVTYIVLFLVMNFVIIKLFHFSKNGTLFLCYNFPALLISNFYLHSIGQDGNYLHIIKLLNSFNKYFYAKYIIGITISIPSSIIYCLIVNQIFDCCDNSTEVAMLILFVIISCIVSVYFALSIGTSFLDNNVKRLYLHRGVTVGGEMLFYFLSWVPGTSFVYFHLSIFSNSIRNLYVGLTILLIFLALSRIFYLRAVKVIDSIV